MRNRKSNRVKILKDLSQGFHKRNVAADYMDNPDIRAAYGEYYGEVGFEKGLNLASEIRERVGDGVFTGRAPLRILDLGTGTGAFLRGILAGLSGIVSPPAAFEILCIDRSLSALKDLETFYANRQDVHLRIRADALPEADGLDEAVGTLDLVMMANVLAENEERVTDFSRMFQRLSGRLEAGGILLLVEPADRKASRSLLELGDQLITLCPDLQVLAPCPNGRRISCPALKDPDNWCHEDRPANYSGDLKKAASALGHVKDSLKMSYLIFRKETGRTFSPPSLRLVSPLNKEKGLSWGVFCNGEDLVKLRLLKRNRSDGTRLFFRLKRGDTLARPECMKSETGKSRNPSGEDWPADEEVILLAGADGRPYVREGFPDGEED